MMKIKVLFHFDEILFVYLLQALPNNAGNHIPKYTLYVLDDQCLVRNISYLPGF